MDPFDKSFEKQYEQARREGDKRFGEQCNHDKVKNGRCKKCFRRVR